MTIATTANSITYAGDGVSLAFAYPYPFITNADLKVYVNGVLQVAGYSVVGVAPSGGSGTFSSGTVTFVVAPALAAVVLVYSDPDLLQSTALPANDPFQAKTVERMIDKVTLLIQRIYGRFGNALTFPVGETVSGLLPTAALRANTSLTFGPSGEPLATVPVAGTAVALAITLLTSLGATMIGFLQAGTGAVLRLLQAKVAESLSVFDFMTTAQIADVQARTLLIDVGAAVRAAVAAAIAAGKKRVYFPAGSYLIGSTAGADTFANGILLPFTTVNPDPTLGILLYGDGPPTLLCCGSDNMILARVSRNHSTLKDMTLDGNGKTNVWGCGIVPESMTQTTTLVSQQEIRLDNVTRQNFTEGLVIQPGPWLGGSDSGCFFMNISGASNLNTRHVYFKKNVDWATHANRPGDIKFWGQSTLRGNTGYYVEVGSRIEFHGCVEELIATGVTPCAVPTGRYISADATEIQFLGGKSEGCTRPVDVLARNSHQSRGFSSTTAFPANWYANMEVFGDLTTPLPWTPVLASSGGGAQGASTSTGYLYRCGFGTLVIAQISVAKGTLGAGNLTITGLRDVAFAAAGLQHLPVVRWSNITIAANNFALGATVSGATISLFKSPNNGAASSALTVAECTADPIVLNLQGWVLQ